MHETTKPLCSIMYFASILHVHSDAEDEKRTSPAKWLFVLVAVPFRSRGKDQRCHLTRPHQKLLKPGLTHNYLRGTLQVSYIVEERRLQQADRVILEKAAACGTQLHKIDFARQQTQAASCSLTGGVGDILAIWFVCPH